MIKFFQSISFLFFTYEKYIVGRDIYSRKQIKLPTPKFIVFYNGESKQPERKELRLSDAFEIKEKVPSLELIVTQLNINSGCNKKIMDRCPTLFQYMQYVDKVRQNRKSMALSEAVVKSVEECIADGILKGFLLENKAEVVRMTIYEYDEELHKKTLYEEGFEDGAAKGYAEGAAKIKKETAIKLYSKGISIEDIADAVDLKQEEVIKCLEKQEK